jgi:lipoate-protein ligase A
MPRWRIEHRCGDVGAFHTRDLPTDERVATFFVAPSAALVLGSSQHDDSVDIAEAQRRGIEIVKRTSGGGGVLLLPDEYVWLDLEIPATDELWSDDVGRAMWWVGEMWSAALRDLVPGATVHRSRMIRTRWSGDVCFAGVGPGELMIDGAKVVGISQRRTRDAARFQTMIHRRWRPDVVSSLVAAKPNVDELAPLVHECPASADDIVERLVAALGRPSVP